MIGSAPVFSVSDFVATFNQSLDMLYPEVLITGELSNFRISKNAWVYFDLKDEMASVKFFGSVRSLPGPLEDGMLLEVTARPYLHPQFGFSLQISDVAAVGTGSINKAYLLLLKKLEGEGLFDPARKRSLPYAPEKVGLVTSKESAAYGDFMKIITHRWPNTEVRLFDVQVQGRDAPEQLARALEQANQRVDLEVIVMIRGGGSKDDLVSFDHESVVRAVAASRIPTLVAIGHERDVSLSEMAADARASTPSNAAEMLVPDRQAERNYVGASKSMLGSLIKKYSTQLIRERAEYSQTFNWLLAERLNSAKTDYDFARRLLLASDPKAPLEKGYILAKRRDGALIITKTQALRERNFSLEFKDGTIAVETEGIA